ncbi:MAG: hypothetical protein PHD32_11680 [Eubacteriales bacterium]|nr:hypothetical protein [Eubacteriales bacterium]
MKKRNEEPERMVRIRLPLREGASDVVEIGLNGVLTLVRRGEAVEMPEALVQILKNAGMNPEML